MKSDGITLSIEGTNVRFFVGKTSYTGTCIIKTLEFFQGVLIGAIFPERT
jgi:hypothetical protein